MTEFEILDDLSVAFLGYKMAMATKGSPSERNVPRLLLIPTLAPFKSIDIHICTNFSFCAYRRMKSGVIHGSRIRSLVAAIRCEIILLDDRFLRG